MKHFQAGFLFFLTLLYPQVCFASISLNISNLTPKEDHYFVTAVVSGMSSSSGTFVQGMFTPSDSNQYFGFTFSSKGEWVKYDSSPEKPYVLENYIELKNDQPTTIYIKPDYKDPDYSGPGRYHLKLKRYTASGSPSDYSNVIELTLSETSPTPSPTNTPTNSVATPTSTPSKSPTTASSPTKVPTSIQKTPTESPQNLGEGRTSISTEIRDLSAEQVELRTDISNSPQVLATTSSSIATESSTSVIANLVPELWQSSPSSSILSDKNLFIIGSIIFVASGSLLYFRLKNL